MSRADDLDAWFAQADDILTDWEPGIDAGTYEADGPDLLETRNTWGQPVESYYDEPRGRRDQDGIWRPPGYWQNLRRQIEASQPAPISIDGGRGAPRSPAGTCSTHGRPAPRKAGGPRSSATAASQTSSSPARRPSGSGN